MKGRGEFHLRFDSLTLPNGTTRDFRARVSGLDGRASEELDRKEGTIKSEGKNRAMRARSARPPRRGERGRAGGKRERRGRDGRGHRRGGGRGGGTVGVLFTRGPEAVLAKGTTIEMVLDRHGDIRAKGSWISPTLRRGEARGEGPGPLPSQKAQGSYTGAGR